MVWAAAIVGRRRAMATIAIRRVFNMDAYPVVVESCANTLLLLKMGGGLLRCRREQIAHFKAAGKQLKPKTARNR
jgi:hypothetical protein